MIELCRDLPLRYSGVLSEDWSEDTSVIQTHEYYFL